MKITEIRIAKAKDGQEELTVRYITNEGARAARVFKGEKGEIQKIAGSIFATGEIPLES